MIRTILPFLLSFSLYYGNDLGLTISSDFISGYCGETEKDHEDTLSLMREVQFDQAFMFAYSLREKVRHNFIAFVLQYNIIFKFSVDTCSSKSC